MIFIRRKKEEGRRKKEEGKKGRGRRKKEEGRRKKERREEEVFRMLGLFRVTNHPLTAPAVKP
ncbi:hypothetical protein QUB60_07060 [Microcoleus sp. A2-C5]|uniref:hypothetical protein n=1 Tax=unclassified Microcoleus TaxID=2642155 RepID=UPI002FCF273B